MHFSLLLSFFPTTKYRSIIFNIDLSFLVYIIAVSGIKSHTNLLAHLKCTGKSVLSDAFFSKKYVKKSEKIHTSF